MFSEGHVAPDGVEGIQQFEYVNDDVSSSIHQVETGWCSLVTSLGFSFLICLAACDRRNCHSQSSDKI